MTYQQTLDYLYARLPMYHRVGVAAYKANLDNTTKLAELLGKPHTQLNCIHVGGTNGKGSSSHILAAVLQNCGYKVGLYTSPHLIDFRERIKINGKLIPKHFVVEFVEKYKDAFKKIKPSFFEWTFALALDSFVKEGVDVAIIEVGLGGRLDSTNIITPQVSLITNISLDHTNLLGSTLDEIGREKAGIIKKRVPVVISQYQSETASMFNAVAREKKSPIEYADRNYKITDSKIIGNEMRLTVLNRTTNQSDTYELDLTGRYQAKNFLGVLNVLQFVEKAGYILEPERVKAAFKQVVKLTGLRGRWEKLNDKPLIIADTGHNEDGIKQVIENLKHLAYDKLHFVFGAVNDKDVSAILALLPKEAEYYFVKASIPRALNEKKLLKLAHTFKLQGQAFSSVELGLKAAKKAAKKTDCIFIGGSTFVVGDVLALLKEK
ncbi:MAG: bifunctional folylpolyglutamate synthase/dihydrofolate synthase [Bacteroidetes bacterium]|nr:bifunctional folylpolyglutamate synthase/dihydrofolate synthase [Bacteroidota bacterium]